MDANLVILRAKHEKEQDKIINWSEHVLVLQKRLLWETPTQSCFDPLIKLTRWPNMD